jgi:hypothetical protein
VVYIHGLATEEYRPPTRENETRKSRRSIQRGRDRAARGGGDQAHAEHSASTAHAEARTEDEGAARIEGAHSQGEDAELEPRVKEDKAWSLREFHRAKEFGQKLAPLQLRAPN